MQGLKGALDILDANYCAQRSCSEAKLWYLTIAGCSSQGTKDEEWFFEKIVQSASTIELDG